MQSKGQYSASLFLVPPGTDQLVLSSFPRNRLHYSSSCVVGDFMALDAKQPDGVAAPPDRRALKRTGLDWTIYLRGRFPNAGCCNVRGNLGHNTTSSLLSERFLKCALLSFMCDQAKE